MYSVGQPRMYLLLHMHNRDSMAIQCWITPLTARPNCYPRARIVLLTLGFLFFDPLGRPRGLFITGAPSSCAFCDEKS